MNRYELKHNRNGNLIRVPDAYSAFAVLTYKIPGNNYPTMNGIQQPVYISATANYGEKYFYWSIQPYLGENVKIGNNVKIFPNAYIGDNVRIGDNSVLYIRE